MKIFQLFMGLFLVHSALCQNIAVQYQYVSVDKSITADSSYIQFLQPYKDSLIKKLNTVIGFSVKPFFRKQPEGPLGNLVADAILQQSTILYKSTVDMILIAPQVVHSYMPKGDVTIAKVYDVIPTDDRVLLLKVDAATLVQILDTSITKGGWPMAGIQIQVKDNKLYSLSINNKPLNTSILYTLATTQKTVEQLPLLKTIQKMHEGILVREMLIQHIVQFTQQSQPIEIQNEHRFGYAK